MVRRCSRRQWPTVRTPSAARHPDVRRNGRLEDGRTAGRPEGPNRYRPIVVRKHCRPRTDRPSASPRPGPLPVAPQSTTPAVNTQTRVYKYK